MMACGHGNTDCVAALLESGLAIDLELRDGNGMHALQLSATTEIKQMLRKYRAQVEAEALARQLEEEEQEAERRAAEDAEMAEREREEAQVRAELEALVEAKNHAEAEEQKKVAELQFLKSELETALWKMCEAQTAHLTCPNDLAVLDTRIIQFFVLPFVFQNICFCFSGCKCQSRRIQSDHRDAHQTNHSFDSASVVAD
jgi:ankyrin repeat protein